MQKGVGRSMSWIEGTPVLWCDAPIYTQFTFIIKAPLLLYQQLIAARRTVVWKIGSSTVGPIGSEINVP